MTMRVWMVMMVFFGVAASEDEKNHNGLQHKALCDLIRAAVGKWGSSGEGLSDPLKKALGRTIFGDEEGKGSVESLRDNVPTVYNGEGLDRGMLCGQPRDGEYIGHNQDRWAGHSAPHDLVCLCTVGNNSFPLNGTSSPDSTLCGKSRVDLKADEKQGWTSKGDDGKEQITATWSNVTSDCLRGDATKGEKLKETYDTFIRKLVTKPGDTLHPNRKQLGEGTPTDYDACTGSSNLGVCVMYYPDDKHTKTWWVQLGKAFIEDEQLQKQRAEEEKRKQQEEAEKQNSQKPEALTSTPQTPSQTEQQHNANLTDKLRRFNLTSGTPISQPSSWLLSVVLLI